MPTPCTSFDNRFPCNRPMSCGRPTPCTDQPSSKQMDRGEKPSLSPLLKEINQACLRLDIQLTHAPVRDGAAKGKIERFFRGFRDRFLTLHTQFNSIEQLNQLTHQWIENDYNNQYHSGIQMRPLDRFNLDHARIHYISDDQYSQEIFFIEEPRKVSKTNVFSINATAFEAPADLRGKTIHVRYCRTRKDRFIVYFNDKRMGDATALDVHHNATRRTRTPQASS